MMLDPIGPGTSKYNIYDDFIATEAEVWIARAAKETHDRPWVLFVGFVAPHFPLTVPAEILALYPTDAMPSPRLIPRTGIRAIPGWRPAIAYIRWTMRSMIGAAAWQRPATMACAPGSIVK